MSLSFSFTSINSVLSLWFFFLLIFHLLSYDLFLLLTASCKSINFRSSQDGRERRKARTGMESWWEWKSGREEVEHKNRHSSSPAVKHSSGTNKSRVHFSRTDPLKRYFIPTRDSRVPSSPLPIQSVAWYYQELFYFTLPRHLPLHLLAWSWSKTRLDSKKSKLTKV